MSAESGGVIPPSLAFIPTRRSLSLMACVTAVLCIFSFGQTAKPEGGAQSAKPESAAPAAAPGDSANTPAVTLDTNEALFAVLASINHCGYDADLNLSVPVRAQVRADVEKASETGSASEASQTLCQFYSEHQASDNARTLADYVSLALYLTPAPALEQKVKDADMPPDTATIVGIIPFLAKFYKEANLHEIWQKHQVEYNTLLRQYHNPVSEVLQSSELYLKLPSAGYLGHSFTVYIDPLGSPLQTNARNYGADYFVVISPGRGTELKLAQIRHTYLHYLLDPFAVKYSTDIKKLDPLLPTLKSAPLDENFRTSSSLLATECLIRAIEARTEGSAKTPEAERLQAVQESMEQGYVLTRYFYDALGRFEKAPDSIRSSYREMIDNIDVKKEARQASQIQFASKADPEVLHLSRPVQPKLLQTAEQRLAAGDAATAQKLAQEALDDKTGDAGRAYFILAQSAIMNRDMDGAKKYFEQTIGVAHEPKVVGWSHIYLGRIMDLQQDREGALGQYHAALDTGGTLPEVKAAAEKGIQEAYEPPSSHAQ